MTGNGKKTVVLSGKAPKPLGPYSQAIMSGNLVFVSGQIPVDPVTGAVVTGNIETQTRVVFANIQNILSEAGASLMDIVKISLYLTDLGDFDAVNKVFCEIFVKDAPARETLQVAALPKSVGIEVSVIAAR